MFQSNPRRWHCRMLRQDYSNHQTRFWLEWSLVRARHSRIWSPQDFAPDPDQWCKPSLFTTLPKTNMVHLKMNPCKRRFLFESIMFRFHVNFRGGVDWVWLQIGMSALTFEAQRTFLVWVENPESQADMTHVMWNSKKHQETMFIWTYWIFKAGDLWAYYTHHLV